MSESGNRKQTRVQRLKPNADKELRSEKAEPAVEYNQDVEMTADLAQQLQPQVGNEALQSAFASELDTETERAQDVEIEEDHDQDLELDEDVDLDQELSIPSFGGNPGNPDATDENPWATDLLFGGDDDDQPKPRGSRKPRRRRNRKNKSQEELVQQSLQEEHQTETAYKESVARITRALPPPPATNTIDRSGDARFRNIEDSLSVPSNLAKPFWKPEDLLNEDPYIEPVMMSAEIGRFLANHARSTETRSLASLLVDHQASFLPTEGGYAAGAARVAHLSVCSQSLEVGDEFPTTDDPRSTEISTAVSVSLEWDCWPDSVSRARTLAREGKLHAPLIFDTARDDSKPRPEPRQPGPRSALIEAAICHLLPKPNLPEIPEFRFVSPRSGPADPLVDELDDLLTKLTTGDSPPDEHPVMTAEIVKPYLNATRHLLNSIGRLQVEMAAAALAVSRVDERAFVMPVLSQVDQRLRRLARAAVGQGNRLSSLIDQPMNESEDTIRELGRGLGEIGGNVISLREWAIEVLAASASK